MHHEDPKTGANRLVQRDPLDLPDVNVFKVDPDRINSICPPSRGEREMENIPDSPLMKFRGRFPEMKRDPMWLTGWLDGQHTGELNAVASMEALLAAFRAQPEKGKQALLVERVVAQEKNHVELIGQLLKSRGVAPRMPDHTEVLPGMDETGRGCAIASRAEAGPAGEIRIIVTDPETADDVRRVFSKVLMEESFHERAFAHLAGEAEMSSNIEYSEWCPKK